MGEAKEREKDRERAAKDVAKAAAQFVELMSSMLDLQRQALEELRGLNAKLNAMVSLLVTAAAEEGIVVTHDLEGGAVPQETAPIAEESGLG